MTLYNVLTDPQMYLSVGILMLFVILLFGIAIFISARRRKMKMSEYLEWERQGAIQRKCDHLHWLEFEDGKIKCEKCKKTAFITKKPPNAPVYH